MQWFVGGQQAPVLSQSSNQLQVTIPYTTTEGAVDITVEQDSGSQTLEDAFAYFEDATGKTSAIGNITLEEYIGGYWNQWTIEFASLWLLYIAGRLHLVGVLVPRQNGQLFFGQLHLQWQYSVATCKAACSR